MTDKEIIIAALQKAERRMRGNRLCNDLSLALALFLLFPLAFKICDLVFRFSGTTIAAAAGIWITALIVYSAGLVRRKGTLAHTAASIDKRAALHDELRTAYWFIENPRPSGWVDVQIQRAAKNVQKIDVDRVFPRAVPHTLYLAGVILVLVVSLNFIPSTLFGDRLSLEAAKATTASDETLDLTDIAAGLQEIARDLQESRQMEETAEALFARDLSQAATELREVAQGMENMTAEDLLEMQLSLQEASENSRPGLQELSDSLKEAAGGIEKQDQRSAQRALEQAAQELEQLGEMIEAQLTRNARGQAARNIRRNAPLGADAGQALEQTQQGAGWDTELPEDRIPVNAPPGNAPMGLEPSGDPVPNPPRIGPPTTLKVQLEREKLDSQIAQQRREDKEEASKEERSKIDYRDVPSDLRPAQKDVLNQDWIPTKYRELIRNYFQAIRPPE